MITGENNKRRVCRNCSSYNLYWYDGCLGYEAIKCKSCGYEHGDLNPTIEADEIAELIEETIQK